MRIIMGLGKLPFVNSDNTTKAFISVIIPFRNESENILASLTSLSAQDYPKDMFEVIYVNDLSSDDSLDKLLNTPKPSNFKVLNLPMHNFSKAFKKRAISYGIEHSKGEIIITTDADCSHEKNWLKKMSAQFSEETGFVSGPVKFKTNGTIFSKLQALEFSGLVLAGAGLIGIGKPTICNGANLGFRKKLFIKLKGYSDNMHLSSGEDELLMQKIAAETDYLVKFCWDKDAVVSTNPNLNYRSFYYQRKRWASKGLFYKNKKLVLMLMMIYLFYLSIPIQLILTFTLSVFFLYTFILSLLLKFIMEWIIISKGKNFLFERSLTRYLLIAELFQITYITIVGLIAVWGKLKWKDRILER